MSTGTTTIMSKLLDWGGDLCQHVFICDDHGFRVCRLCGEVEGENFVTESHLIRHPFHSPLRLHQRGPATRIGFDRECNTIYSRLATRNLYSAYDPGKAIQDQFRTYLSRMDLAIPIDTCMQEYYAIAPLLPKSGKARQAPILCAILLITHLRSQQGRCMQIQPFLKEWGVSHHDFMAVEGILSQYLPVWTQIKTMECRGLSFFQHIQNHLYHLTVTLRLPSTMAKKASCILKAFHLPNRIDIQVAAAMLTVRDLFSEYQCVKASSILGAFQNALKSQINVLKHHLLKRLARVPTPKDDPDSAEVPPINRKSTTKILSRWIIEYFKWRCDCLLLWLGLTYTYSRNIPYSSLAYHGKQILIRQGYFPPPYVIRRYSFSDNGTDNDIAAILGRLVASHDESPPPERYSVWKNQ